MLQYRAPRDALALIAIPIIKGMPYSDVQINNAGDDGDDLGIPALSKAC
jgi:hypothetical protein